MSWIDLTVTVELAVLDAAIIICVVEVITLIKYVRKLIDKRFMTLIGPSPKKGR